MSEPTSTRRRILDAAARLLEEHGRDGVTTRAVSYAAGVQPPTIYRHFTDMSGLLGAVAADGFDTYLARKHAAALSDDPVQDLRDGWDTHVEFGLTHPAHYLLMYGRPVPGETSPAAQRSADRLHLLVERIAAAGRLTVTVETAAAMIHSAGSGLTLHLIGVDPDERDPELPGRLREAVLRAVTGDAPPAAPGYTQHATALKAALGETDDLLTAGEQALLGELLDRLGGSRGGRGRSSAAAGAPEGGAEANPC
ncbi:TetR/AcrR family transcriptional regulator [Promicromonospora iranensis]|uniref:AcrR family transcriptional regulator n=1 Tax=Promicromonospora iranensis TaxID=1105144 RepID=A0ABU2CLT9_9MICO|nr:TetR/AcrR family transcriptional regulator [Promicromonospora iranensis]MDR7382278.1 AcrR family transcriptional regulator [Promicromonospora iranensis]